MKRLDIIIPHENLVDVNMILHNKTEGGVSFHGNKGRGVMKYVPKFGYRTRMRL